MPDPAPPTIAYLRDRNAVPGVWLTCLGYGCGASQAVPWAELKLPDDTPFPRVAGLIRRRCRRCGSAEVGAMPDWPGR